MEDILFYICGLAVSALLIYLVWYLISVYQSVRQQLVRKGIPLNFIKLIEDEAIKIVKDIESRYSYENDPKGTTRHMVAKFDLEIFLDFLGFKDRIDEKHIDKLIEGAVKGAELVKGKNPYKK